jgi:hypothetical protein
MGLTTQKPRLLQLGRFYDPTPGLSTSHIRLQSSISVLIISWHNQHVNLQFYVLFPPTLTDLRSDQYSLSRDWKPVNFALHLALFHSKSTNVGRIATLKALGETAQKTAQSTCWQCYNTIRTQILNWRQRCKNNIVGTAVWFQHGQKLTFLYPVRVSNLPWISGSGS